MDVSAHACKDQVAVVWLMRESQSNQRVMVYQWRWVSDSSVLKVLICAIMTGGWSRL